MVETPDQQQISTATPKSRFHTQLNAQIEVYGKSGKAVAKISNLSKSGAMLELIQTKVLPVKGEVLQITILLNELQKKHRVSAEVIWSHGLSLGVQFLAKDLVKTKILNKKAE